MITLTKTATLLSVTALGATLLSSALVFVPAFASDDKGTPTSTKQQWLSIGQVHQKLEAAGYQQVEKIEREHGVYEARATDRNGERVKLYINPQTGELTQNRRQRERGQDGYGEKRSRGSAASAECNKRRCRDDLPASSNSVQATPPATR